MSPQKKKPTSSAKPKAVKVRAVKARAKPKPRAKAARTSRPSPRAKDRPRVEITRDEAEQPARPVAVGEGRALWESAAPAPVEVPVRVAPAKESPQIVDQPWAELGSGVFAVLLAGSVFLPWYHSSPGNVSGWSSGTWGPIIFFLSLAALAIVILRRAGVAIAFPVESPLVVEGIGWACVIGLILKRYLQPIAFDAKLPSDGWIFVSLACALGLALLAGMASKNTAFVMRPRWFTGKPGWIGIVVTAVALAAGITIGLTNTSVPVASPTVIKPGPQPSRIRGLPPCATKLHLPTPAGFTAYIGYDSSSECIATWFSTFGLNQAYSRYTGALKTAGWTVTDGQARPEGRTGSLKGRGCGSASAATQPLNGRTRVIVSVIVYPCSTPSK